MQDTKLPEEEIVKIKAQYQPLSETLHEFARNMRGREYRKTFNKKQRDIIRKQFDFYRKAINATVRCLIANEELSKETAMAALKERYVKFRVKLSINRYLRRNEMV